MCSMEQEDPLLLLDGLGDSFPAAAEEGRGGGPGEGRRLLIPQLPQQQPQPPGSDPLGASADSQPRFAPFHKLPVRGGGEVLRNHSLIRPGDSTAAGAAARRALRVPLTLLKTAREPSFELEHVAPR